MSILRRRFLAGAGALGAGPSSIAATGSTTRTEQASELNKLAYNVAVGRSFAGIHYRSDSVQGLLLGERVAVRLLRDLIETLPEDFPGYVLTGFGGERIEIAKRG